MILYKKGDIREATEDIIAQGCNCKGVMGSGVAKILREKWPSVYGAYLAQKHYVGLKLGNVDFVQVEPDKIVANCLTQKDYLPRGICHADYKAILSCMLKVKEYAIKNNKSIAIPKIGAGLAGGDWKTIENILKEVFDNYDITVYTLD